MVQNYFSNLLRKTFLAVAIAAPGMIFAGNIPQYTVSKGTNKYSALSGATTISGMRFYGNEIKYADGSMTANSRTAAGFPLGFNFRFGGQMFDCFAVENCGNIYLGRDGIVTYDASNNASNFCIGMSPITYGLESGTFSYKTTGTEGSRVFTLQIKSAKIADTNSDTYRSTYNLQIRLYEADGKIEMAFSEGNVYHSGSNFGFATGLHGWNNDDRLYITTEKSIDGEISVSDKMPDMLAFDSYIHWDGDDYTSYYKPVFVFTPSDDMTAPAKAPTDLKAEQNGNILNVSCKKAEGADATVILYSNSPLTAEDYPIDGETFLAGKATFGNAAALYYGNDANVSVAIDNIENGKDYYIEAISVSGYPVYAKDNGTKLKFSTAQAAPDNFIAAPESPNSIELSWESGYPVIIAMTTESNPAYQSGYAGLFGKPQADANVGDILPQGGKIIYVGDAKSINVDALANTLTFFRIWSVNGSTLSATYSDAASTPNPSYPYEPELEYYPFGDQLQIWNADIDQFIPWKREYKNDAALRAVSVEGSVVSLESPELDLSTPVHISFEYSLETVRPANDQGIPMGNEPGKFGNGALTVKAGNDIVKSVSSYEGSMTACPDGYESGSSTFETVELDIDAIGKEEKITIAFNTETTSYLYLKNIKITQTVDVPKTPTTAPTLAEADEDESANLHFSCIKGEDAEYTLVLFSKKPITENDYPQDGVIPAVGSTSGNARVLYYGNDENVECATNYNMVIADYNTTYYFAALAASANPLYNRENVTKVEYTTMKEAGKPTIDEPDFDGTQMLLTIKGTRHADAASTIVLISEDKFNGTLEDGRQYNHGDEVGNAKVIYHGTDDVFNHQTNLVEANKTYTLTAVSANERGWWSDSQATHVFTTNATGVESIGIDKSDLSNAEIHNVMGIRINASCIEELPKGIYIINGKKISK